MKERYIELMEQALCAYPDEHIRQYFQRVRKEGLTEHGFPRLTANIGILIAHGRRTDLLPLFVEMMDFCCESIPRVKAANDFSVREIVCCMREIEAAAVVPPERLSRWKALFAAIEPTVCYSKFALTPTDPVRNWALFTGVSEFFRQSYGLCDSREFIDLQIASQLQWLDENGMYMDNPASDIHQPIVYDLVPRGLFSLLLHFGYRGRYYPQIDDCLRRAGLLTLRMQSSCGELPFGGRSNQFLHNEAWLSLIFEYEANRYAAEGDLALSAAFKHARDRAVECVERWLSRTPIRHIKNRFPTETKFGCERYAYFDKYMITVASFLYAAYLVCDDSLPAAAGDDERPDALITSPHFHKIFLRCGRYSAELDTNADPHYDASGLGRIHRRGAPTAIALSVPCPAHPSYRLDAEDYADLSFCPGVREGDTWRFATDGETVYVCEETACTDISATARVSCRFPGGARVESRYTVSDGGVTVEVCGKEDEEIAFLLPAFAFDGERQTEITARAQELLVRYEGACCRMRTNGEVIDTGLRGGNRNGHYRGFAAVGRGRLRVEVEIG